MFFRSYTPLQLQNITGKNDMNTCTFLPLRSVDAKEELCIDFNGIKDQALHTYVTKVNPVP